MNMWPKWAMADFSHPLTNNLLYICPLLPHQQNLQCVGAASQEPLAQGKLSFPLASQCESPLLQLLVATPTFHASDCSQSGHVTHFWPVEYKNKSAKVFKIIVINLFLISLRGRI